MIKEGEKMEYEYENLRRVSYCGDFGMAVFVPVCEKCCRFVKADEKISVNMESGRSNKPNATCKKCGRTNVLFEGFI
jgi:hypothetical protein